MYFPDLSRYAYLSRRQDTAELNVGWLDATHDFPKGVASDEFLQAVWKYSKFMVFRTRGIHFCELCGANNNIVYKFNDEELKLGTAELRVFSNDGLIYAAPNLLFHYIRDHGYVPPTEFINAALTGPQPESDEYISLLRDYGFSD